MKASKFSEVQIDVELKQAENGTVIGKVRRKTRIFMAAFYMC
jgi:hypothetical protein